MMSFELNSESLIAGRSGFDTPGSAIFDPPVQSAQPSSGITQNLSLLRSDSSSTTNAADDSSWKSNSYIVISGGTGGNAICTAFGGDTCYALPVSDDGGSSSEIIRVLGGPSIGDIRSRLVRLIPASPVGSPLDRIRNLLAYRLKTDSSEREAREEWRDIVEGSSVLWSGIPADRKEVIRGFLVNFESEVLKRAQKNFSFRNGSIGNYFIAAAQSFFRSLPSAIFLFSSITSSKANIQPVIVTNHTVTIAVELENGKNIVGQCNISHPVRSGAGTMFSVPSSPALGIESLLVPSQNFMFDKASQHSSKPEPLESKIRRLFYINAYGVEIKPFPNLDFLRNLASRDTLVYSCGSLWTSIIPCLALRGVGSAIACSMTLKAKVVLLNSQNDRETAGYTAIDYVNAITRSLNDHGESSGQKQSFPSSAFITHLVHLKGGTVTVDEHQLSEMGIQCLQVERSLNKSNKNDDYHVPLFDADTVSHALRIVRDS